MVVDQGVPQSIPAPSTQVGGTPDLVGTLRVRGKFDFKSVSDLNLLCCVWFNIECFLCGWCVYICIAFKIYVEFFPLYVSACVRTRQDSQMVRVIKMFQV